MVTFKFDFILLELWMATLGEEGVFVSSLPTIYRPYQLEKVVGQSIMHHLQGTKDAHHLCILAQISSVSKVLMLQLGLTHCCLGRSMKGRYRAIAIKVLRTFYRANEIKDYPMVRFYLCTGKPRRADGGSSSYR